MDTTFIILIIIGLSAFALFTILFSNKAVIKRKLKKTERKGLSKFIDGESARVVGTIECTNTPLTAPLSGRKCAYYYILVEQQRSSGKSSSWHTLIEEEVSGDFVIRDGVNRACIKGPVIKSYIVQDRRYKSGFFNDATQNLKHYLKQKGRESENMLGFNKTLRYKEGVLEQGEEVAVYGKGVWKKAESLGLPESFGRVLEIQSTSEEPVYLSDDPATTQETTLQPKKKKNSATFGEADSKYFKKSNDNRYFKKP